MNAYVDRAAFPELPSLQGAISTSAPVHSASVHYAVVENAAFRSSVSDLTRVALLAFDCCMLTGRVIVPG